MVSPNKNQQEFGTSTVLQPVVKKFVAVLINIIEDKV